MYHMESHKQGIAALPTGSVVRCTVVGTNKSKRIGLYHGTNSTIIGVAQEIGHHQLQWFIKPCCKADGVPIFPSLQRIVIVGAGIATVVLEDEFIPA